MTPPMPELETILDRLARLECQNRRLRRIVLAGLFLLGAAFIVGQARPNRRVEAREFVLTDASGAVRAVLAVNAGEPRLTLLDSHENVRAVLGPEPSASGETAKATEAEPRDMLVLATATVGAAFVPATENSRPRLTQAGFSPARPSGESVHEGAPLAGFAILNALHPLIPALVTIRDKDAKASRETPTTGLEPQPRGNQSIVNSGATSWRFMAQLAELVGAPRFDSGPAPSPASVKPATLGATPHKPYSLQIETAVPRAPADLALVKWNESRALRTAPVAHLARNPFEFAGQPAGITLPSTPPPAEKIPVAPRESLPAAPPVALKALGYAESAGSTPQAIISDDVNIYVVRAGDSFAGRFQVVAIDPTGVDIDDRLAGRSLRLAFNP